MSTPLPSPSATDMSTNQPVNTSNLLFGFLVTALSVFAIFMSSALVWNRLVARRRDIDAMLEINLSPQSQLHRPPTWDVWILPCIQSSAWPDVRPVAVWKCDSSADSPRTARTEQTPPLWRRALDRVPPEISYLFHRPLPQAFPAASDATSSVELVHGSDVQVSLLICMPHAPQTRRREGEAHAPRLPEMAFATTNVPYHDPSSS